jgi:acetyltransferase
MSTRNIDRLFEPRSVALVTGGAGDGLGPVVARNLLRGGFAGPILPVVPGVPAIDSVLAYESVRDLPMAPDLAIFTAPDETTVPALADLGSRGCRAAILMGSARPALLERLLAVAGEHLIRVLGPDCFGLVVPRIGLNASLASTMVPQGNLACICESSTIVATLADWASSRGHGFSRLAGWGGGADVEAADLIDWLAIDDSTRAVLVHLDHIGPARRFLSAARAVARVKPVIIVKAGRSESDPIWDAAFRRAGMLRVRTLDDVFGAIETLSHARAPTGERIAILANGRGLGTIAMDALASQHGIAAEFRPETLAALAALNPDGPKPGNPLDLGRDADGARYAAALRVVTADRDVDACLVLHGPQALVSPTEAAEAVIAEADRLEPSARAKIMVAWLGDASAQAARARFLAADIPGYETPEQAIRGFGHLVEFRRNQRLLVRVPPAVPDQFQADTIGARAILEAAAARGETTLDEERTKDLLACYRIPVAAVRQAATPEEVARVAASIGGPIAVKILSPDITYKSDIGGVALDIGSPTEAEGAAGRMLRRIGRLAPEARVTGFAVEAMIHEANATELAAAIEVDPIFGPVISFGRGGTASEVEGDTVVALPPLDLVLAADLVRSAQVHRRLAGFRNVPAADLDAIALTLVKLSHLAADLPWVAGLRIDPLLAHPGGVIALDARTTLGDPESRTEFAILPYPSGLENTITLPDGTRLLLRPVRPEDAKAFERTFARLKPEDIHSRFFSSMKQMPAHLLSRLTQIDYDREMALVAVDADGNGTEEEGYGVARLVREPSGDAAEYAVLVRSDWKGRGLGRILMEAILDYARATGVRRVWGMVLRENRGMLRLAEKLGFRIRPDQDPSIVIMEWRAETA